MDPNDESNFFDFTDEYESKPDFPLLSVPAEQFQAPQPLECLQGNPIPPFLSKTYDLAEDPALDPIISWGRTGQSFVVWDPIEFARVVLPRNFKHNNFSSFVRQLNTYIATRRLVAQVWNFALLQGFRKIDTDKWEFANESFLRGNKHLLKNIRRRRAPHQSQQATSEASEQPRLETEVEKLRKDKSVMMQELVELRKQHIGTAERVKTVKHRLQASEQRQKQMVAFLAKAFQNQEFVGRLREMKTQRLNYSVQNAPTDEMLDSVPQFENVSLDELIAAEDLMKIPVQIEEGGGSSFGVEEQQPLFMGKELASAQPEYFVDLPETESLIKQEDELNMGFDYSTGFCSPSVDLWGTVANYEFPGISISDIWDSEIEKWPSDESPAGGSGSKTGDEI